VNLHLHLSPPSILSSRNLKLQARDHVASNQLCARVIIIIIIIIFTSTSS
jgi:hypothetical protein